jgi:hypothetical protein
MHDFGQRSTLFKGNIPKRMQSMYKPKINACMALKIAPPRSHERKEKRSSHIYGE